MPRIEGKYRSTIVRLEYGVRHPADIGAADVVLMIGQAARQGILDQTREGWALLWDDWRSETTSAYELGDHDGRGR